MRPDEKTTIEEVTLDHYRLYSQTFISRELLDTAKVEVSEVIGIAADQMAVRVRQTILGNPAGRVVYSFPATPWQFFKARHFPDWLKRRFPVREDARAFSASVLYPEAKIKLPALGRPVFHVEPEYPEPE